MATVDNGRNEVEIDLEKYTAMVLKLDEAQDKIREMEKVSKELKIATAAAQPVEKFSIILSKPELKIEKLGLKKL